MRRDHQDLATCVVCGGAFLVACPNPKDDPRPRALLCHECRTWSLDTEISTFRCGGWRTVHPTQLDERPQHATCTIVTDRFCSRSRRAQFTGHSEERHPRPLGSGIVDEEPFVELVAVQPVRAYDKSSLDQFVIAAEHERERLQEALDQATRRRAVAEHRRSEAAKRRTRFIELIEETQRLVVELRRENERAVAAILRAADVEAEALAAARRAEKPLFQRVGDGAESSMEPT